jgi:DNA-directed RNA polymerase delta subunit
MDAVRADKMEANSLDDEDDDDDEDDFTEEAEEFLSEEADEDIDVNDDEFDGALDAMSGTTSLTPVSVENRIA